MSEILSYLFRPPGLSRRRRDLIESANVYMAMKGIQQNLSVELTAADYELQNLRRERGYPSNATNS